MSEFIIIGAGPAGIAAGIALTKRGHSVSIYERADSLYQRDEDSYPIGLNPRGLRVFDVIDPSGELRKAVADETPIDAWSIYRGASRITRFPSGTTVGATRIGVAYNLYKEAQKKYPSIQFFFSHKFVSVDFETKSLTFENTSTNENKTVDGSNARIIACDGVWSRVRKCVQEHDPSNTSQITPWDQSFRLLFSSENPETVLDPREHHIFSAGIYVAVVQPVTQKWVIAVQVANNNPYKDIFLGNEDSEENRKILKDYIAKNLPQVLPMIPDDEYSKFFSRRSFSGAVICISQLNFNEWILFLGDSAHAVYPAIGEGVNCALEDVHILDNLMENTPLENLFSVYNETRHKDIVAVTNYAKYLVESGRDPTEKTAQMISTITLQTAKKFGLVSAVWNDKSFGTSATDVQPYSVLYETWLNQTRFVLPVARAASWAINGIAGWF